MRLRLPLLLALASVAVAEIGAQTAPLARRFQPMPVRSGTFDNPTAIDVVVFQKLVTVPDAPWIRLAMDEVRLPGGSYLEIVSVQDGHRQQLTQEGFAAWQNTSAYFNGDALLLRLVAAPGAEGVSVGMTQVEVGVDAPPPPSICGSSDDRIFATDRRVCRVVSIGCTGWLINRENCLISAGHCCGGGFSTAQFNVPRSSSSGSLRHPGPEDQYPVISSSIQRVNGGIGNDWCVFQTRANTQTGLHAGRAQNSWFPVTARKPAIGATIRITGFGTASGARNQAQTTHTGPLRSRGGTTLCYSTDTTGGNSGSPVIDEASGRAVGVHSHAGCSSSGGCNRGTSASRQQFIRAFGPCTPRDNDRLPPESALLWTSGEGCPGSTGHAPELLGLGALGDSLHVQLDRAPSSGAAWLMVGRRADAVGTAALPLDLGALGMPGCTLRLAPDAWLPAQTNVDGAAAVSLDLPGTPTLVGERLLVQWLVHDPAANAAGLTLSDVGHTRVQ
ncbi:MAG: trypsin-like peptidase domain-containing protein [Planctomycetota bacterium]